MICSAAQGPGRAQEDVMSDSKATETPQAIEHAGHKDWERAILGENGISGTLRVIGYIAVFALVFGTLFSFIG
jgi:hypothetical protein